MLRLFLEIRQYCKSKYGLHDLTGKQPQEVSLDSEKRNYEVNAQNTDGQAGCIDQKSSSGFAKSVDRADQCRVCIEERADPGKSENKLSGRTAVENKIPKQITSQQEAETAEQSQNKTAAGCSCCKPFDICTCSGGNGSGDSRSKHSPNRTGNGRGKKNTGKCHTRENTVYTQCFGRTAAEQPERCGNRCCFNTLKQSNSRAVGSQRC